MSVELHLGVPAELDAATLYCILRLRVDVFVVEQQCPYPELDGRDLDPGTRWLWATEAGEVIATLRILRDNNKNAENTNSDKSGGPPARTARIGRVATARSARSAGVAGLLLRRALELVDGTAATGASACAVDVVLDAQTPLAGWYRRFGFETDGAEFVEDGISHLPMRRPARAP